MAIEKDWEKFKGKNETVDDIKILDAEDIALLTRYGQGPYLAQLKAIELELKGMVARVSDKMGVKESDTGLAPPNLWDIPADKQRMHEEQSLQVARCTKIITENDQSKYLINIKQIAKFVVGLGERVAPTDIEEGMRVGYLLLI